MSKCLRLGPSAYCPILPSDRGLACTVLPCACRLARTCIRCFASHRDQPAIVLLVFMCPPQSAYCGKHAAAAKGPKYTCRIATSSSQLLLSPLIQEECTARGATIVYATHIFDGLESWPTHVAYVARGALQLLKKVPRYQLNQFNTYTQCLAWEQFGHRPGTLERLLKLIVLSRVTTSVSSVWGVWV
jgi:hypothetical protein